MEKENCNIEESFEVDLPRNFIMGSTILDSDQQFSFQWNVENFHCWDWLTEIQSPIFSQPVDGPFCSFGLKLWKNSKGSLCIDIEVSLENRKDFKPYQTSYVASIFGNHTEPYVVKHCCEYFGYSNKKTSTICTDLTKCYGFYDIDSVLVYDLLRITCHVTSTGNTNIIENKIIDNLQAIQL